MTERNLVESQYEYKTLTYFSSSMGESLSKIYNAFLLREKIYFIILRRMVKQP